MWSKKTGILMLAALLVGTGAAGRAQAAQIDAALIPEFDRAAGAFTGTRFVQISYDESSHVSKLFNGRTERIEFSVKGSNSSGMAELVQRINAALLQAQSPAKASSANLTYSGVLKGGQGSLTLTYRVQVDAVFSGFKLDQSASEDIPVDVNWRGFAVDGPVPVDSQSRGMININQPIGLLEAVDPGFAGKLLDSGAKSVMLSPMLDFGEIGSMPMERWHWLFDPTLNLASTSGIFRGDIGRAKVFSVYSLGECSIREGCPPPREADAVAAVDGTALRIHSSTPQPNAQIEIAGFTGIEQVGQQQIVRVKIEHAQAVVPGFTLQVLLVLGGMMGAIAVGVLLKARK